MDEEFENEITDSMAEHGIVEYDPSRVAQRILEENKRLVRQLAAAVERAEKAEAERDKDLAEMRRFQRMVIQLTHCAEAAENSWRCYHCGKVFLDPVFAAEHFGDNKDNPRPAACEAMLNAYSEAFERYGVHRSFHNAASVKHLANRAEAAEREVADLRRRLAHERKVSDLAEATVAGLRDALNGIRQQMELSRWQRDCDHTRSSCEQIKCNGEQFQAVEDCRFRPRRHASPARGASPGAGFAGGGGWIRNRSAEAWGHERNL